MNWDTYAIANKNAAEQLNIETLEKFVQLLRLTRKRNGKVWILGNGGSASTASHAVADFGKTTKSLGGSPLFALAPSEWTSMQSAYANDVNFAESFSLTLSDFLQDNDLVWIISVSGKSPNLVSAIAAAKALGAITVSTVGMSGSELTGSVDLNLIIPSNDYQIVENIQLMIMHWLTKQLAIN